MNKIIFSQKIRSLLHPFAITSLICLTTLGSTTVFSKTVLSIATGVGFSDRVGKSQNLNIGRSHFHFDVHHRDKSIGLLGFFLGPELGFNQHYAVQIGLGYYHPFPITVFGKLTQGIDARSADKLAFRYNLRSQQVFAESKWLYNWRQRYHPYLSVALGASFNRLDDYAVNAPRCLTTSPQFSNHDRASFSYAVGLGVDVDLHRYIRFGAGYRFVDLGRFTLGHDKISGSQTLTQSKLYLHEILAQISFVF